MAEVFIGVVTVWGTVQVIYKTIETLDKYVDDVLRRKKNCQDFLQFIKDIEETLHHEDGVLREGEEKGRRIRKEVNDILERLLRQLREAEEILKRLTRPLTVFMPANKKLKRLKDEIRDTITMLTFKYSFLREVKVQLDPPPEYLQSGCVHPNHDLQTPWNMSPWEPASLRLDEEGSAYPPNAYRGAHSWTRYVDDVLDNQQ